MPSNDIELISPGLLLRGELSKIFPYDPHERAAFVTQLDEALRAEGDLSRLIYESTLNFILRRLITTAEYFKRKYFDTTQSEDEYWSQLRYYLREYTTIPYQKRELIFTLLLRCVEERAKRPSDRTRNSVVREARKRSAKCYICGRDVVYDSNAPDPHRQKAEVEHIWPKALGGNNNESNLTIACERCNRLKADHIDYSDFHYEEICGVTDEDMLDSFDTDFNWSFRIAVLSKFNFVCSVRDCGRSAQLHGELRLSRIDPFDSWHFLNVEAYCDRHSPRR